MRWDVERPPYPKGVLPTVSNTHPLYLLYKHRYKQVSWLTSTTEFQTHTKNNSKNQSKHTPFPSLDLPHLRVMLLCLDKQMHTGLTSHLRFPHTPQLRADKTRGNFPVRYFPPPTCNSCNYVSSLSLSQGQRLKIPGNMKTLGPPPQGFCC